MSSSASATTGKSSNKTLGLIPLVAFAVGTMVGGGVFALSGIVVKDAGPGAIISYVLAGLVMLLSALCFAAVASRAKRGESGYAPIATVLSPKWRFITMWAFYIAGVTGIAYVLMSFANYLLTFIPGMKDQSIWFALGAAVLLALLNFGPAALVGKAETAMVVFKLVVLLMLIFFGFMHFAPAELSNWVPHGGGSILSTTALLFTAYTGFNVITNMSGSVENPGKVVPKAIILSLAIVAIVYIGVAIALVMSKQSGAEGFAEHGLTLAAKELMGSWGGYLVALAACVSTLSGANANMLGSADLIVNMSGNGDLPSKLGRLNKKGDPVRSVALTAIITIALLLIGVLPGIGAAALKIIVIFCNVAAIAAMVIVDVTALKMGLGKWKTPGMKLPGGPIIPILAIVTALLQVPSLGWWQVLVGLAMVAVGFPIWARRSKFDVTEQQDIRDHIAAGNTPMGRALLRKPKVVPGRAPVSAAADPVDAAQDAAKRAAEAAQAATDTAEHLND
ncbi:APC family permease [Actinomyces minihominis]|uniref:APC family permease n=1 Tax=Actinomyces minihominis TaxID=2002838 RepID=UPI0013EC4FE4|nr:APC family permease [Actinomyces minihominis]